MASSRPATRLSALLAAVALGLTACTDNPSTTGATPRASGDVPITLQVSTADARPGERVAVAVSIDPSATMARGILGSLKFDAARLRYIGQSVDGGGVTLVNEQSAATGSLRFTSFNTSGLKGRAALFVFEAKSGNYAPTLRYENQQASAGVGAVAPLRVVVRDGATVDASLVAPADAHTLTVADWAARLGSAQAGSGVALRPGEVRDGLKYGDVNYDNLINLDDYLLVANAVVGNRPLIVGTDGPNPANDIDLVIAGNVNPKVGAAGACGVNAQGERALDLDDYLEIASNAVLIPTPCAGVLIRPNTPTTRQPINATSTPNLIVEPGETMTLTNDRVWQLEGILEVQNGGTLIVNPGTRIEGLTGGVTKAVFVRRGGQIFSNGTAAQPVVFTCTAVPKTKGCWGGVFIAGRGTVNLGDGLPDEATAIDAGSGGANSRAGEGGAPRYGGNNPADNSGRVVYTRFEYGGLTVNPDVELNNFTLGAVGSGTEIHHIQVHGGSDDGIEFFGGNVNTSYIVATGNDDDAFDVSFGLTGTHQFVVVQVDQGASGGDSKGIEADGYEDAANGIVAQNLPRTSPNLFNFTIIGNLSRTNAVAAIHLRRGSGLRLYNSIVHGFANGLDIDDALTCNAAYGDGNISILNTTFVDIGRLDNPDGSDPACGAGVTNEAQFITASSTNRTGIVGIASILRDATNTDLPDWRMLFIGGNPAEGATALPVGGAVATNYRGAVAAFDSGGIPWYSGWTIGFQGLTTP